MQITAAEYGFRGCFPDLPGCGCECADPQSLYAALEQTRRRWITRRLLAGREIPMPNSTPLRTTSTPRRHHEQSPHATAFAATA